MEYLRQAKRAKITQALSSPPASQAKFKTLWLMIREWGLVRWLDYLSIVDSLWGFTLTSTLINSSIMYRILVATMLTLAGGIVGSGCIEWIGSRCCHTVERVRAENIVAQCNDRLDEGKSMGKNWLPRMRLDPRHEAAPLQSRNGIWGASINLVIPR